MHAGGEFFCLAADPAEDRQSGDAAEGLGIDVHRRFRDIDKGEVGAAGKGAAADRGRPSGAGFRVPGDFASRIIPGAGANGTNPALHGGNYNIFTYEWQGERKQFQRLLLSKGDNVSLIQK